MPDYTPPASGGGGGAPTGAAGGSLAGTYPNPTIAASAITTTEIADGTIATGDIASGAITSTLIADGTIVNADVAAAAAIQRSKLLAAAGIVELGGGTYFTEVPGVGNSFNAFGVNHGRFRRVIWPKTGTLSDIIVPLGAAAGNCVGLVYDTGQANADHTIRTRLDALTSVATAAAGWISLGNPALSVVEGVTAEIGVAADSATTTLLGSNAGAAIPKLPAGYFPSSGAGTAVAVWTTDIAITVSGPAATVTDATWQAGAVQRSWIIGFKIT